MKRSSSSILRTWDDCNRAAYFEYGPNPKPKKASFAMATGTIGHAILEFRTVHGRTPTRDEVAEMEGNYDDPVVALDTYGGHGVWELALNSVSAPELEDPRAAILDALGILPDVEVIREEVELPLESFGIVFPSTGVSAEGYIDHYLELKGYPPIIWDWKIRGRLDYAPRTEADFRADIQQTYYPSVVQLALGCESVIVAHGNILRTEKKPVFRPAFAELPAWFLEAVFTRYDADVVALQLALDGETPVEDIERNTAHCWKYGKACQHMNYCEAAGKPQRPRRSLAEKARAVLAALRAEEDE